MRRSTIALTIALLASPATTLGAAGEPSAATTPPPAATAMPASPAPAGPEMRLEPYQLVLLQRPENPSEYPPEKLEQIQAAHLAHLGAMARAGKMVVAGPLDDQPDPKLRGICLYRVSSLDEAKKLAGEDPAVKAGRLEVVVMTWYVQKGALAFPMAEAMAAGKE